MELLKVVINPLYNNMKDINFAYLSVNHYNNLKVSSLSVSFPIVIIKRVIPEGPQETLLVVDATTGQNGVSQLLL